MYTIDIFPDKELVVMVFNGVVDFKEIMNANITMANNPRYKQSFNGVVDHRKTEIKISREEIAEIAKNVATNDITVGKWVILVESPESTALSTLYASNIKDQHPENIYSTIKGASKYLGFNLAEYLEPSLFD